MWIALNDGFLSVVEPRQFDVPAAERVRGWKSELLMVRARKAVHLKRHFPERKVYQFRNRDYPARVFAPRSEVARVIGGLVAGISYDNFKNSVRDGELHDAYMGVWSVMHRYQHGAFSRKRQGYALRRLRGYAPPPHNVRPLDERGWEGRYPESEARNDVAFAEVDEPGVCGKRGCRPEYPCMDCMTTALRHINEEVRGQESDRYGDFDEDADADAASHLRVPPK